MKAGEAAAITQKSAYHLIGRSTEARALFDKLLSVRNDVGLLSEEYDGERKHLMGNFPQAFTQVAWLPRQSAGRKSRGGWLGTRSPLTRVAASRGYERVGQ